MYHRHSIGGGLPRHLRFLQSLNEILQFCHSSTAPTNCDWTVSLYFLSPYTRLVGLQHDGSSEEQGSFDVLKEPEYCLPYINELDEAVNVIRVIVLFQQRHLDAKLFMQSCQSKTYINEMLQRNKWHLEEMHCPHIANQHQECIQILFWNPTY